jgi:pilus retraction protein PilT
MTKAKEVENLLHEILAEAAAKKASDLHLSVGAPPAMRMDGSLQYLQKAALTAAFMEQLFFCLSSLTGQGEMTENTEIDFAYTEPIGRFRIHVFKQQNGLAMAIRLIPVTIPSLAELGLPSVLADFSCRKHGLLLFTGATGSGKSTSLAAIIDLLNRTQHYHIITLEDPIEYVHYHKKSIVNQREAGKDFKSFSLALRAALREDPDVIMVGELRDKETVETALIAAETGHLVLGTLHTFDTTEAILRIESLFPSDQQDQIRMQLSLSLQGIIAQQLLPGRKGGRVCAVEVLNAVSAVRNLIREGKSPQLFSQIQTGRSFQMITMDMAIRELLENEKITKETANLYMKKR